MLDLFVPYKKKIVREQRRWIVTVWRARPTLHSISRKCVSAFGMFAVSRMVFFIAFFNLRQRNNAIYRQKTNQQQHSARGRPHGLWADRPWAWWTMSPALWIAACREWNTFTTAVLTGMHWISAALQCICVFCAARISRKTGAGKRYPRRSVPRPDRP